MLTFAGFPSCLDINELDADIAIIGVPFGVPYPGSNNHATTAPQTIRQQSQRYGRFLSHHDFNFNDQAAPQRDIKVVDCGDVPRVAPDRQHAATEELIRTVLAKGAIPIVLGGDHSVPIPVMRAFDSAGPMCVVQIDAHIDYRDEVHGIRDGLSSNMRRASELPHVDGIVQIGIRGVGSARAEEVVAARNWGTTVVRAAEIHRNGIEFALDQIPHSDRYYITLDMDGIDPAVAPGVVAPSFGGLTYFQVFDLLRGIGQRGRIVGVDVVEVAPANDLNAITSLLAARLVLDAIEFMSR